MKIYIKFSLISILLLIFYSAPAKAGGMFSYIIKVVSECIFAKPTITENENTPLVNNNNNGTENNNNHNNAAIISLDISFDESKEEKKNETLNNNNNTDEESTLNSKLAHNNGAKTTLSEAELDIDIEPGLNFETFSQKKTNAIILSPYINLDASKERKENKTLNYNNNTDAESTLNPQLAHNNGAETTHQVTPSPVQQKETNSTESLNANLSTTGTPPSSKGILSPSIHEQNYEDEIKEFETIILINTNAPQGANHEIKDEESESGSPYASPFGSPNSGYGSPNGGYGSGYDSMSNSPYSGKSRSNSNSRNVSRNVSRAGSVVASPETPININRNRRDDLDKDILYNFQKRISNSNEDDNI